MPSPAIEYVRVPSLVMIAQVVFLLDRGHTQIYKVTDMPLITLFTHRLSPALVISMLAIVFMIEVK